MEELKEPTPFFDVTSSGQALGWPLKEESSASASFSNVVSIQRKIKGGYLPARSVESSEAPLVEFDETEGLRIFVCTGLFVIPADTPEQFIKAVRAIQVRQESPRDKGAIIIPRDANIRISPEWVSQLALQCGIIYAKSTLESTEEGALAYAKNYERSVEESLESLNEFMENSPPEPS